MNRNLLIGLGVFLAVVAIGFFLVRKPSSTTKEVPVPGSNVEEKIVNEGPAREITVTANEYSFNPAGISVKAGEKIKLTLVNAGSVSHNLTIDELNVKTKLVSPGKSDTIEFTAEGDSNLVFYCNVGNHRNLGMEGKLEIK